MIKMNIEKVLTKKLKMLLAITMLYTVMVMAHFLRNAINFIPGLPVR